MKKAFTLMELLIVVSIIALLGAAVLALLNPMFQIKKSWDSKRKGELATLNKVLEDWYNDKQCYPTPSEICYDGPNSPCHICGSKSSSPNFSPYLPQLPCDPQSTTKQYLYQVDNNTCPSWYRIYTTLSNTADPVIVSVGCQFGCGPAPDFSYNYGVSSPNIGLEGSLTACLTSGSCGDYCSSIGKSCSSGTVFESYSDTNCQDYLGFCNGPFCCSQNPIDVQVKSYKCFCQ